MCLQSWDGEHDWEVVGDEGNPDCPDDEDAPHRAVAVRAVRPDDAHRGVGGTAGMNTEETTMDVTYYDRHGRVTTPPQGPTLTITPTLPPGAVGYRVLVPATHVVARPRLRCRNRRAWLRSITRSGWRMVARVTL